MPRFFGSNLDKKPHLNTVVLRWLQRLPDGFDVFVELEGSDFQVDFLVFKKHGIFDIEAKAWAVKEARLDADWILADGATREDPFLQVLDQCAKVREYLLQQRNEIFGSEKARIIFEHRNDLKAFPIVAISKAQPGVITFTHSYRKVYVSDDPLRRRLTTLEWFPHVKDALAIERGHIDNLAALFHLEQIDPNTLLTIGVKPRIVASAPGRPSADSLSDDNPYQYKDAVKGDEFYGRDTELLRIKRALESVPSRPIMIVGLQRTGKSSLVRESIRRFTEGNEKYTKLEFDFRRLSGGEGLRPDEDLTFELLAGIARDATGSELGKLIESHRQTASKSPVVDQRRLFRDALRKNSERKKRTILFLDECQDVREFLSENRHQSFFAFLDSLCREPELNLDIILASRPEFNDLEPIRKINLGRLFEVITLGPLEEVAARALVARGSIRLGFDEAAIKLILFITGRHPFWLQLLCHRLFEIAIQLNQFQITESVVEQVFREMVKDPGRRPHFYLLYQDIETDARSFTLLKAIADAAARKGGSVQLDSLGKSWEDPQDLRKALKPLIDNQILTIENVPTKPAVRFKVEALRAWLRPNLITL